MADGGTGEKTEEPTPERLRKLRKEGNVPKSQDVTSAIAFLAVFCTLAGAMSFIGDEMIELFNASMLAMQSDQHYSVINSQLMNQSMMTMLRVCAPALAVAFVVGMAMNVAQVGFMFTTKPIMPDIKKLNPVNGVKNLVNMKKLVELLKTIIKFTVVSYLSYLALKDAARDVALIIRSELIVGMKVIGAIIWDFCTKIGAAFVVIAAFDAFYQKKRYIKDNMMSKYDIKQEYKQSEGDPQHKAERKRFHQEILNSASPSAVKNADVVVRNPEHIAVALKYDDDEGEAPSILAKGTRVWAEKILDAAREYGVPIVRNVPLAQALNKLEVGDEVPEELYEAVAEVLNFVYNLAEEQKNKGG